MLQASHAHCQLSLLALCEFSNQYVYSFINYPASLQLQAHWDISGAEQLPFLLIGGGKVQTWTSDPLFMLPRLNSATTPPKWEAALQGRSHASISFIRQNPWDIALDAASCHHTHTAHAPLLGHYSLSRAPRDPRLRRPVCGSSAAVSPKAAPSKPSVCPTFSSSPLPPVCFCFRWVRLLSRRAWSCQSGRNRACLRHHQKEIETEIRFKIEGKK